MKEKPMLWSPPMVLAKLAGRKWQTRRVLKPQPLMDSGPPEHWHEAVHQRYSVGDLLWGREAWKAPLRYDHLKPAELPRDCALRWLADGSMRACGPFGRYRHARFMPRWASRLLDEVTGLVVERLLDISNEDAIAEGIEEVAGLGIPEYRWPGGERTFLEPRDAYLVGWDTINGEGSAASNPWVSAISFDPVEASR